MVGLSTPYRTGTGYLITPVVGFVRPGFTLAANPDEVADIFETPFGFLMDPANLEEHERELPSGRLDFARLAVLADALEEAGCTDQGLLGHLRAPGVHVRGCWGLDAVLGWK